jgi:uncharacterized membrane protein
VAGRRGNGRAKLILPTRKGRRLLAEALRAVEEIERGYAEAVGTERFEALAATMQAVLDAQREKEHSSTAEDLPAGRGG